MLSLFSSMLFVSFLFCPSCFLTNLGGRGVGAPPLPIPNREVKPDSADGTAIACGRVGSRRLVLRKPSRKFFFPSKAFVFYMPLNPLP